MNEKIVKIHFCVTLRLRSEPQYRIYTRTVSATLAAFRSHVLDPCREDTGATATEYAVLVGSIAMVIVAGVASFGAQLASVYNSIAATVSGVL